MTDCIFCKVVAGEISWRKVKETDEVLAFEDANPQTPIHILVIPKRHIETVVDLAAAKGEIAGKVLSLATAVARDKGLAGRGFRLVFNHGRDGGQAVNHVHLHILGGRRLGWPPG
jgi:histidine triad (HIT) family protein